MEFYTRQAQGGRVSARPANLQVTVKQAAALMNISERSIYYVRELERAGRADLLARMQAGEISINKAMAIAGLRRKKSQSLFTAWREASEAERDNFVEWLNSWAAA